MIRNDIFGFWRTYPFPFVAKDQQDIASALKQDWSQREEAGEAVDGRWLSPGDHSNQRVKSLCGQASSGSFEVYGIDQQNRGTSDITSTALYCESEKKYWVEQVSYGCFGYSYRVLGPFDLINKTQP